MFSSPFSALSAKISSLLETKTFEKPVFDADAPTSNASEAAPAADAETLSIFGTGPTSAFGSVSAGGAGDSSLFVSASSYTAPSGESASTVAAEAEGETTDGFGTLTAGDDVLAFTLDDFDVPEEPPVEAPAPFDLSLLLTAPVDEETAQDEVEAEDDPFDFSFLL